MRVIFSLLLSLTFLFIPVGCVQVLLLLRMSKYKLFLLRHGEGAWNKENRFCSWVDQKLSEDGVKEAQDCGRLLKEQGYKFDLVFTSILSRSIQTAWLVLEAMGQEWVPVVKSWRLNERHYGSLIGLNRAEMAQQHGEEKVKLWRRSYAITPPPIDESHPYFLEIYNDRRYTTCDVPIKDLPRAESLKEVLDRLLPYWDSTVVPEIRSGRTVLISAHGNSCRALLKHLEGMLPNWPMLLWSVQLSQPLCICAGNAFCWIHHSFWSIKAPVFSSGQSLNLGGHISIPEMEGWTYAKRPVSLCYIWMWLWTSLWPFPWGFHVSQDTQRLNTHQLLHNIMQHRIYTHRGCSYVIVLLLARN